MRNYETVSIARNIKRQQTNRHAANIFCGYLLMFMSFAITIDVAVYVVGDVILFPILESLAIVFSAFKYGESLINFTMQDRYSSEYIENDEQYDGKLSEDQQLQNQETLIRKPNSNSFYRLQIPLSTTQLDKVIEALLKTNSLTINYIESLGLARQEAERLRVELSTIGLVKFDRKNRVRLTDLGKEVLEYNQMQ